MMVKSYISSILTRSLSSFSLSSLLFLSLLAHPDMQERVTLAMDKQAKFITAIVRRAVTLAPLRLVRNEEGGGRGWCGRCL